MYLQAHVFQANTLRIEQIQATLQCTFFAEDNSEQKFASKERGNTQWQKSILSLHIHQTAETIMKTVQLFAWKVVVILHTCNDNEYWPALKKMEPPTTVDCSKIGDHPIIQKSA